VSNSAKRMTWSAGVGGRQIALAFCAIVLAAPSAGAFQPGGKPRAADGGTRAERKSGIVLDRDIVNITVTVSDRFGRYVSGLDKEHFEVFDDKIRQPIAFFSQEDAPASIGIVYDVSGSMREATKRAFLSLDRFLTYCHRDDDLFVVGFNERPQLTCDFTARPPSISNSLVLTESNGRTAFFDAVYFALEKARQGKHVKRALVIISDGQDNASRYTMREVREALKEADILVYAIGIANPWADPFDIARGFDALDTLCRTTGGLAFFPKSEAELADSCIRVALELRHQYSIGFYPSARDEMGRWHKLKVRITPPPGAPRVAVRAREGYYGERPLVAGTQ
jgi:Ca-activated chloride channel family protein